MLRRLGVEAEDHGTVRVGGAAQQPRDVVFRPLRIELYAHIETRQARAVLQHDPTHHGVRDIGLVPEVGARNEMTVHRLDDSQTSVGQRHGQQRRLKA